MLADRNQFPLRYPGDSLDVAGLVAYGLSAAPAGRVLMTFEGRTWTAAAMRARVAALRGALKAHGLRTGDRVAVTAGNEPRVVELIYVLVLSGIVWVPVNGKQKVPGLAHLLSHGRPNMLLASAEF